MKRAKDGEKVMGPMFPRLHVNDKEKGGPRAPPRNKMALYEQLCVPSQRFNPGSSPLQGNTVPPSSSGQVSCADRKTLFPLSKPTFLPEKLNGLASDRYGGNTSLAQLGQHNKPSDEDEFTVPVFARSREGQEKSQNRVDNENFVPFHINHAPRHSMRLQTQNSSSQKILAESEDVNGESRDVDKCSCESGDNESPREIEVANASNPRRLSPSGNTERSDDVSQASILDSVATMDISPDDVVGILGQKHFWKARRAITHQQRVFAVQVFELHRLIKVQKLIAGSPNLLLEDTSTTLSKPSSKDSPATKVSVEINMKSLLPATRKRDEPEKPTHPVECSAENAVTRAPVFSNRSAPSGPPAISSSGQWGPPQHQPGGQQQWLIPVMSPTEGLVYKPCYPGPGFSSSSFCGPYGSSPIIMGNFGNPAYGVPTHPGMGFVPGIPQGGHSYFPTYGMPVMSVGVSGAGSGSISAVEQVNHPSEPTPGTQTGHVLRPEPSNRQLQSSCNDNRVPVPRTAPTTARLRSSMAPDLQGSTGSSPAEERMDLTQTGSSQNPSSSNELRGSESGSFSERAKEPGNVSTGDGKDELLLFPMAPTTIEADRSTRVIRAVPHNARSTSASVARIFRSIQDERKHYDMV